MVVVEMQRVTVDAAYLTRPNFALACCVDDAVDSAEPSPLAFLVFLGPPTPALPFSLSVLGPVSVRSLVTRTA